MCVLYHERNERFGEFGTALEWFGDFLKRLGIFWSVWGSFGAYGRVLERLRDLERLGDFWSVWKSFEAFGRVRPKKNTCVSDLTIGPKKFTGSGANPFFFTFLSYIYRGKTPSQ